MICRLPLSKRAAIFGVLLALVLLGIGLRQEAGYSGFNRNDLAYHEDLVVSQLDAFRQGSLGLDLWYDRCCFGAAVFRTYQNLGNLLAAGVSHWLGLSPSRSLHYLLWIALLLQVPAFYRAARLLGFSRLGAVFSGWLSLTVSAPENTLGNEFRSYLSQGHGLFTQALAFPSFVLALACLARVAGGNETPAQDRRRRALEAGLWFALTFLLHELYGYILLIVFATLVIFSLLFRRSDPRTLFRSTFETGALAGILMAYQLWSLFEDKPLMHRGPWERAYVWDGFGWEATLRDVVHGAWLDANRWPILSLFCGAGILLCLDKRVRRIASYPAAISAVSLFFLVGRAGFGTYLDWLPGIQDMHLHRFSGLLHASAIWLAALAMSRCVEWARESSRRFLWPLAGTVVGLSLFYLAIDRAEFLRRNDANLAERERANATLDPGLFGALGREVQGGRVWTALLGARAEPKLAGLEYCKLCTHYGLDQISAIYHNLTYPTDVGFMFRPGPAHYRLFDVTAAVLTSAAKPPPFSQEIYRSRDVHVYRTPGEGMLGVVGVTETRILPITSPGDFPFALKAWMDDPSLADGDHTAVVPKPVADRWPSAVPEPSPSRGVAPWGEVESWSKIGTGYRATLVSNYPGAYGVLRIAYHPRWRIRVNGQPATPRWISPGFLAFSLAPGRNEVSLEFPEDPIRVALFLVGMVTAIFVVLLLWVLPPLRARVPAALKAPAV